MTAAAVEVRCKCGRMVGEQAENRLISRRLGLEMVGGSHVYTCDRCGSTTPINLNRNADVPRQGLTRTPSTF